MKIFVTGASGFIGGAIAKRLAPDHFVLGMARDAAAVKKVTALGVRAISCSLTNISAAHMQHVDVVIHCAAFVEPWGTWQDFYEANVVGTQNVLQAAKEAKVPRFIHIGTEAALFYGQDMNDIDETYPYPPKSPYYYSESKKQAEIKVLEANETGVFDTFSIRPRLVWGPDDTSILPNLLEMVDKGRFRWLDGGRAVTSTTHIANLVEGVLCALTKGTPGQAYFVTDHEIHSFRDFLTQLLATKKRDPGNSSVPSWLVRAAAWLVEGFYRLFRIKAKPPVTRFAAAIMSANCTIASDKAELELGYRPVISVADGMAQLMQKA
jgi:nucleoside-diphosphate-sugar epimerase